MPKLNQRGYYRKPQDLLMWHEFDQLWSRLKMNGSSAITEAVREWTEKHKDDPSPSPPEVKPRPARWKTVDHDPFA